jgi:hypothetical protein
MVRYLTAFLLVVLVYCLVLLVLPEILPSLYKWWISAPATLK